MLAQSTSGRSLQLNARRHHAGARAAALRPVSGRRSASVRAALPELPVVEQSVVQTGVYATLGLAGLGFVGTFFILPQFKGDLKEGVQWPQVYQYLTSTGPRPQQVEASDAYARSRKGAVLVDVRTARKYEEAHADKARSVPLYYPIQDWDLPSILRRVGFALFAVDGTELNPQFGAQARATVPKGKEVILLCETGGSLENKNGQKYGFQSRSLKAAYYLLQEGYTKISYVRGGMNSWVREGLPMAEGEDDGGSGSEQEALTSVAGRFFGRR